ncbi:MAG TPA: M23 family metallopeptidase [Gammaproteobacteria bacterium]|nr:M23 family metallopeptidase [Gammaproteobacteria bacterium]
MSGGTRHSLLAGAGCGLLLIGSSSPPSSLPLDRAGQGEARVSGADATVTPGEQWFKAMRTALDEPLRVDIPFAERTQADGRATAFSFKAAAGQTLEITVASGADAADDGIYVEVFRVVDVLGEGLHERLAALRPTATSLRTRLPSDGTYHVLVQGGSASASPRRFTVELGAALPFPVVGAHEDAIRSLFGASRDSGERNHLGVDIFVQRLTPVLAVAAGRAMPRKDALGGNTVWLNTPGTSYYYAHLDRVAVREEQQVKVGDVLGYVGNTGNARHVSSHLHFGVYRWGKEPIDPLPLIVGQRFDKRTAAAALAAGAGG